MARLRERHIRRGGIDADDAARRSGGNDGIRERTGSGADVEHGVAVTNAGEAHEQWRKPRLHLPMNRSYASPAENIRP